MRMNKREKRLQREKNQRKKRREQKAKMFRRKVALGVAALGATFVINSSVSFADADINGLFASWYNKKAEIAQKSISAALSNDLEVEKIRLRDGLEAKMNASSKDLDKYTEKEIKNRQKEIKKYVDELIKNTNFSNEDDKKQVREKLMHILTEAQDAMNELKDDYEATRQDYIPPVVVPNPVPTVPEQPKVEENKDGNVKDENNKEQSSEDNIDNNKSEEGKVEEQKPSGENPAVGEENKENSDINDVKEEVVKDVTPSLDETEDNDTSNNEELIKEEPVKESNNELNTDAEVTSKETL